MFLVLCALDFSAKPYSQELCFGVGGLVVLPANITDTGNITKTLNLGVPYLQSEHHPPQPTRRAFKALIMKLEDKLKDKL